MDILIKIAQLFLSFTILVGLHEFGHFLMARLFKIRVEKFYIFFDPWFSLFKFKRGDTEYGLGWLPLGGYVKIAGMVDESLDTEQLKQPAQPWEFRSKPAWKRFLVMIAGVVMNVLLALVIYSAVCYTWGESYLSNQDMELGYNFSERAHALGFVDGDRILTIDGEPIDNITEITSKLLITGEDRMVEVMRRGEHKTLHLEMNQLIDLRKELEKGPFFVPILPFVVDSVCYPTTLQAGMRTGDRVVALNGTAMEDATKITSALKQIKGDTVMLDIRRGEEQLQLHIPVDSTGRIGILMRPLPIRTEHYGFWASIPAGVERCGRVIASYWEQLKLIVQPKTKMYEELGGFLSIGSIFSAQWDWQDFWLKCAFLSIILAVMNILPIPGLDGGHALFTLWEMLTGRKLSDRFLEIAQYVGLFILLALLLYANGNDIYRFFIK